MFLKTYSFYTIIYFLATTNIYKSLTWITGIPGPRIKNLNFLGEEKESKATERKEVGWIGSIISTIGLTGVSIALWGANP